MQKMQYDNLSTQIKKQIVQVDELTNIYEADQDIIFHIIKEDNKLLAYVSYKQFEMKNIYMIYSFQRNEGYAMKLLSSLEGDLCLEVKVDNYKAINLYDKAGFFRERIVKNLYSKSDGYVYVRYDG